MNGVDSLLARVNERVLSFQGAIVLEALDRAEKRNPSCTYARYIGGYTGTVLHHAKVKREWEESDTRHSLYENLGNLERELRVKLHGIRQKLYEEPCFTCELCLTRQKPWPHGSKLQRILDPTIINKGN